MKWEYQIIKIVKQKEKADQIGKPQNNNFSATARALTNDTGVEVSAGFVASRIKRMAAKEALQKSGVKIAVSAT